MSVIADPWMLRRRNTRNINDLKNLEFFYLFCLFFLGGQMLYIDLRPSRQSRGAPV